MDDLCVILGAILKLIWSIAIRTVLVCMTYRMLCADYYLLRGTWPGPGGNFRHGGPGGHWLQQRRRVAMLFMNIDFNFKRERSRA